MKDIYVIEVSNRYTGEVFERKIYFQYGRISRYCNACFRKYGESTYCRVFKNCEFERTFEEWGA